jgi:hypothetical protein
MTLTLRALLGVEHLSPTGPKPYLPTRPVPLPVAPGDHLWLQIEAPEPVWLTGLLDDRAARFRRVFVVPPGGAHAHRPLGAPLVVTDELSGFRTLWIVASRRELPWAVESLDCGPPDYSAPPPVSPVAELRALHALAPPRIRGLVAPPVANLDAGGRWVRAIDKRHSGEGPIAVSFDLKRRI